jgi:hypothetical protein
MPQVANLARPQPRFGGRRRAYPIRCSALVSGPDIPFPPHLPQAGPDDRSGGIVICRSATLAAPTCSRPCPYPPFQEIPCHDQRSDLLPPTLDDKKAALALAKECPAAVTAIGSAMGKSRGPDGKWA